MQAIETMWGDEAWGEKSCVRGGMATVIHNGPDAGVYFPVYDGNGNVMGYVRVSDGIMVAQYEYGPFGELLRATGPLAQTFHHLFSTKYFDWETGLSYYGHRYYSPTAARWLSRDPIEEEGGVNMYGYVLNNPMGFVDALGLASVPMPPNPPANACCEAILEFLKQLARHTRGRYNDLLADKQFLYKHDLVGWQNHIDKFNEQQKRLEKWIDEFKKRCPGGGGEQPIPVWVLIEAHRRAPEKPLWAERTRHWTDYVPGTPQQIETVGVVSGVVGEVILIGTGVGVGTAMVVRGGRAIQVGMRVAPAF